jgi:hypothetical protein
MCPMQRTGSSHRLVQSGLPLRCLGFAWLGAAVEVHAQFGMLGVGFSLLHLAGAAAYLADTQGLCRVPDKAPLTKGDLAGSAT